MFDWAPALRPEVVALKQACLQEKEEVPRQKESVEGKQQIALTQHERLVDQHMSNERSSRRRADTARKTAAAIEERLQAVYAWSSSLGR